MNLPHNYVAAAQASSESLVSLTAESLPEIESAPPKQFGGPGNVWSPEDLLVAAVADCFVLAFKAIAAASKFEWIDLHCSVDGTLDKVEREVLFTKLNVTAKLKLGPEADRTRAQRLLEKAEKTCFITNSLKAEKSLTIEFE
jgi:peroxiredoxin-like protein